LHRRDQGAASTGCWPNRYSYELYGLDRGFVTVLDRDGCERKGRQRPGDSGRAAAVLQNCASSGDDGRELCQRNRRDRRPRPDNHAQATTGRPDLTGKRCAPAWLYTGTSATSDADGFLYLVDRKKDMIDSGGIKSIRATSRRSWRGTRGVEVAVFGIPHDKWGETPVAAVVLRAGESIAADELKRDQRAGAATYQRLDRVVLFDEVPAQCAGKTLKAGVARPRSGLGASAAFATGMLRCTRRPPSADCRTGSRMAAALEGGIRTRSASYRGG